MPAAGYCFHPVPAVPFRRELSLRSAAAPFVAMRSVVTSRPIVREVDAVLGMGGSAAAGDAGRVGHAHEREAGLAAAILAITLFTFYFMAQMVVRPFEEKR